MAALRFDPRTELSECEAALYKKQLDRLPGKPPRRQVHMRPKSERRTFAGYAGYAGKPLTLRRGAVLPPVRNPYHPHVLG